MSSSRPQKKARLDHDEIEPASPPPKNLQRSKYFPAAPATVAASPPVKKSNRPTDSFFMSDDSIEEAMLSLPDIDDWDIHMSRKSAKSTVQVFEDMQSTDVYDFVPGSDGIEVPASPANQNSQHKKAPLKNQEVTPASRLSLGRFSYAKGAKVVHGLPTPDTSFVENQENPAAKPSVLTPPSSISQRQASQRPVKAARMSLGELVEATSTARPERSQGSTKKIRRSMEALMPINPSFVPLPPADLNEVAALNRHQGSEDQIVPDSDAEDEEVSLAEQPGPGASGGHLDLSRFLCA